MKFDREKKRERFEAEDNGSLEINYSNRGEPYREGIDICVEDDQMFSYIFLKTSEAKRIRDLLNRLYP